MPGVTMLIECPHCDGETIFGTPLDRIDRVNPRYRSFQVVGQDCECVNSRDLNLVHIYVDSNGIGEALYEYGNPEYSRNPIYDNFNGRFEHL